MLHTGWRRADEGVLVSTSFKIIMSIYFQAAPEATDLSRLNRSGFTRNITPHVSTELRKLSLPTSWFAIFRLSTFSFSTTFYFIKLKISVNRVNSNAIISAVEAHAGKRCVEFWIEKIRVRNAREITKEKRYTMGVLPTLSSKVKINETLNYITFKKIK